MRRRSSGILLHPTSLPGPHGAGDLGPEAVRFADRLADCGVGVWQMLPVTVTGAFGSPYDCRSAFAGNPLLVSPDALAAEGLLPAAALRPPAPARRPERADLAAATDRERVLRASWEHFRAHGRPADRRRFERFREAPEQRVWLEDWVLFAALDGLHDGSWPEWPAGVRRREPAALAAARRRLADELDYRRYEQFLFFRHFHALREHAAARGVRLCGDLPMYVSLDSADAWARPELFELDAEGHPLAVAGFPPDEFSPTGQLWGSPVYRWRRHREEGFAWWRERIAAHARLFDLLRLDHFRGFLAFWKVPAGAADAQGGRWARGPGRRLFEALEPGLGALELIAEDLGRITPAVDRLRRAAGLPGMKVLQFAFDEPDSEHLPRHHERHSVVYTGTHDNDTLVGWFANLGDEARGRVSAYLDLAPETGSDAAPEVARRLVRAALDSAADLAILPAQDVLGLGSEARMNTPGIAHGNWRWRMDTDALNDEVVDRLREGVALGGRLTDSTKLGGAASS